MRAVERNGTTVEEATAAALKDLGMSREQVTVEVLQSPRRGLFSGGRKAIVRATPIVGSTDVSTAETAGSPAASENNAAHTAADAGAEPNKPDTGTAASAPHETPTIQNPKEDTSSMTDVETGPETGTEETVDIRSLEPEERVSLLDEECEMAADFVEGLLDLLDLPGDLEIEVTEDSAVVNIADVGSGLLIGRRGATLDALQELVRSTTQRQTERRSHVRIDVEGYRARQLDKLRAKCRDAIAQVRETAEPYRLEPMDSYERKMMHDLVARAGGVTSSSEGAEPKRRVVIQPE